MNMQQKNFEKEKVRNYIYKILDNDTVSYSKLIAMNKALHSKKLHSFAHCYKLKQRRITES